VKVIASADLGRLAAALQGAGYRVVAPVQDGDEVRYREWTSAALLRTDVVPVNSVKDVLLPPSETIAAYDIEGDAFADRDVAPQAPKTVVLAARPCDLASLRVLDAVFNWDYADAFYNAHRAATTLVPLVCTSSDDQCFCTTVGGSPDATDGADAVLRPADGGAKLIFEPLSDKGREAAQAAASALSDGEAKADPPAKVDHRFDRAAAQAWLADAANFESGLWEEVSRACLGCGACAYMCPACHCFDIQDEATRRQSVRLRNWDACGFGQFTAHAGGHNPRADQSARWRNRVMHKLAYVPDRFGGVLACTGCGRCARLCGAGMSIAEVCQIIAKAGEAVQK
jgi:ferredoxin